MLCNFSAESFHTKKLCSRHCPKNVDFYARISHFASLTPLLGAYRHRRMFILGSLESSCRLPISENELFHKFLRRRQSSENSLKITVSEWGASLRPKISRTRGHLPPTICAQIDRPVNALQHCRWQFSHKQTLQHTFFERSRFLDGNDKIVASQAPMGGLGAT